MHSLFAKRHIIFAFVALFITVIVFSSVYVTAKNNQLDGAFREEEMNTENLIGSWDKNYFYIPLEETIKLRSEFTSLFLERYKTNYFNLRPLYEEWIDKIGINGIVDVVQGKHPTCHDEAHDLGKLIYSKIGDIGTSLRVCNDACYSGCMHGVLMEAFSVDGGVHTTINDIQQKMEDICEDKKIAGMYKIGDCVHGVGHAMMFLAEYDYKKAIAYCDLFNTDAKRYYCATGAYMEYVIVKDRADFVLDKPVLYPCDEVKYSAACFRYKMVKVIAREYAAKKTFQDVIRMCYALSGKYRLGCIHGHANAHMPYVKEGQITVADLCKLGSRDDKYVCIEGIIERLSKYYPEVAKKQCNTLSVGWEKRLCKKAAESEMYRMDKDFQLYGGE